MECYEIGSVVRSARIRHGMTQEDLAFGICAVSTLSKIERGICSPKIGTFEALMERMGELPGRCILLVGEQELQRQRIQEEIALAIRLGNRMHLVQQLELYRELSGDNNRQEQQWLSLGETGVYFSLLSACGSQFPDRRIPRFYQILQGCIDSLCADGRISLCSNAAVPVGLRHDKTRGYKKSRRGKSLCLCD